MQLKKFYINKNRMAKICLMLGMFFNPFGFDAAFAFTYKMTGSLLITDVVFYGVALSFFGLYFILSRNKTGA